ncbi:hypothetical protein V8E36_000504 [Tilletia maclaganii]
MPVSIAAAAAVRADSRQPSQALLPASASFWVNSIPGLPDPPPSSSSSNGLGPGPRLQTYAGYIPARPSTAANYANAHLYYVLQRAQHVGSQRRLIIWFNGGPGCSSFDGLMMEIGPWKCRQDNEGELEWAAPGSSWNEYADVIYLDQPVGTGFSYTDSNGYVTSLAQAADEVVYFLKQLVQIFPEYAHGNGYAAYLAGESFAGQYIPYTAKAIMDARAGPPIDLHGIVIGNGYIDPRSQAGSELDMMVEAKIWSTTSPEYRDALDVVNRCRAAVARFPKDNLPRVVSECETVLPYIIHRTHTTSTPVMCINIYDVRLSDTAPACGMNWPPTLASMYKYLARPDVRTALHVDEKNKPQAWVECNSRVGSALHGTTLDKMGRREQASVMLLPGLLDRGLQVLMFAGDKDLICNHIGVERIGQNLVWGGQKGLGKTTQPKNWYVNNKYAGQWTSARNYTYVRIADASHMVGFDKPIIAHDMMLRFMGFDDGLGTAELAVSAGAAARIPSVLLTSGSDPSSGGEGGRKLALVGVGAVAGGGGAGGGIGASAGGAGGLPMIPGVDGKTEEQVAEEAKWAAYYNAGSAALVFLIIAVFLGTCILLRLRRRARLGSKLSGGDGGGGGGAGAYGNVALRDDDDDESSQRLLSGSGAGGRRRAGGGLDDEELGGGGGEGDHELTPLATDGSSSSSRKQYFVDDAAAAGADLEARSGSGRRTPSKVRFTDEPAEVYSVSDAADRTAVARARAQGGGHHHGGGGGGGGGGKARDVEGVGRRDEENIFDVGDDDDD